MVSMGVKLPPIDSAGIPMCSVEDMAKNQNFTNTKIPSLMVVKSALFESLAQRETMLKDDKKIDESESVEVEEVDEDAPTTCICIWWTDIRKKAGVCLAVLLALN